MTKRSEAGAGGAGTWRGGRWRGRPGSNGHCGAPLVFVERRGDVATGGAVYTVDFWVIEVEYLSFVSRR